MRSSLRAVNASVHDHLEPRFLRVFRDGVKLAVDTQGGVCPELCVEECFGLRDDLRQGAGDGDVPYDVAILPRFQLAAVDALESEHGPGYHCLRVICKE